MAKTTKEIDAWLEDAGVTARDQEPFPLWKRIKCRVSGPHDWIPLYSMRPWDHSGLIEIGVICDVCKKEERR